MLEPTATTSAPVALGGVTLPIIIGWALTLATLSGGLWQFLAQQRQTNRQPFLQKQLELCFEATDTAARLATETDPEEWEKSRLNFWRLYWGPLSIVESRQVEGAMVALGWLLPDCRIDKADLPMKSLGPPSYKLAHAVRDLVLASWRIDLPPLQQKRLKPPQ